MADTPADRPVPNPETEGGRPPVDPLVALRAARLVLKKQLKDATREIKNEAWPVQLRFAICISTLE